MRNLGDLVVMPLPTEWTPEFQSPVVPQPGYGSGMPSGGQPSAPGSAAAGSSPSQGLLVPQAFGLPPGGNWGQPFLPDSVLPTPLQRSNPLLRRQSIEWQPGPYDMKMVQEARLWGYIKLHGGLKSCCRVPELGAPIYNTPPWQVMPSNGSKFEQGFGTATPVAPFTGTDILFGQFQVPEGWDGVISRFVPNFTGLGFQDYSNNIFWRLKVGNRFAPDLGNVNTTFGSLTGLISVPGINNIRLISGQNVWIYFNIPVGSPVAGGMITAVCFGWFWPRR